MEKGYDDDDDPDEVIEKKINLLKEQLDQQREEKCFLDLEDRIKKKYSDIIRDELIPNQTMKIQPQKLIFKEGVEIVPKNVQKAIPVPIHQVEAAEVEVARLIHAGVIKKVEGVTEWCSPARFVTKPSGALRIVTDFRTLNSYLKRPTHPFPTTETVTKMLNPGSRFFAKIDLVAAYFQVPLAEESQPFTTFMISAGRLSGRYQYDRGAMGLSPSGDWCCFHTDAAIHGVPGAHKSVDDVIIQARTLEELEQRLEILFGKLRANHIIASKKKFQVGSVLEYGGAIIGSVNNEPPTCGPNPTRLQAMRDLVRPDSKKSVEKLLGLFRTFSCFDKNCALLTPHLRYLTNKNTKFSWGPEHEEEFLAIKQLISRVGVLESFDMSRETYLFVDASTKGLGFILLQKDKDGKYHVITCGSTGLSDTQTRYSITELETLAAVWALGKCKFWLIGANMVYLVTDHKPLTDMMKKSINDVHNTRLQSMMEKTLCYNITWKYLRGEHNLIADMFSRSGLSSSSAPEFPRSTNFSVKRVTEGSGRRTVCRELEVLSLQGAEDEVYTKLVESVRQHLKVTDVCNEAIMKDFLGVWSELGLEETRAGTLLTMDGRLVVPHVARGQLLNTLHRCHPGVPTMLEQARHLYWWPGMRSDVTKTCQDCKECDEHARSRMSSAPQEQENISHLSPMDLISIDLHNFRGRTYLSAQDRCSGFRWCEKMKSQSTCEVIKFIQRLQQNYGKITCVRSDGGPQFRTEFKEYLENAGIAHSPSSPYNPVSNSAAESSVRINKLLQKKTGCKDSELADYILWSNCQQRSDHTGSAAETFFRRNMRTKGMPRATIGEVDYQRLQMLRQEAVEIRKKKSTTSHYRANFKLGDRVVIQDTQTKRWSERGEIVGERPCVEDASSRSYLIDVGGASPKLRNRNLIRLSCRYIQPGEQRDWAECSPVGEDQLLQRGKPLKKTVRFINQEGG